MSIKAKIKKLICYHDWKYSWPDFVSFTQAKYKRTCTKCGKVEETLGPHTL